MRGRITFVFGIHGLFVVYNDMKQLIHQFI